MNNGERKRLRTTTDSSSALPAASISPPAMPLLKPPRRNPCSKVISPCAVSFSRLLRNSLRLRFAEKRLKSLAGVFSQLRTISGSPAEAVLA